MEEISFLTDPSCLESVQINEIKFIQDGLEDATIKPRRRLADSKEDEALAPLISKTRAIVLDHGEEKGLGIDESQWVQALYVNSFEQNYWAVKKIRKYVCGENSELHVQHLLSWQILPRLRSFLDLNCPENLIFETLWIVTNIAAGPTAHTTAIVDADFLASLNKLLSHPSGSIRTQV